MAKFTLAIKELVGTLTEHGATVEGHCTIFSTDVVACPLCGLRVPAHTMHACRRSPAKATPKRRKADRS